MSAWLDKMTRILEVTLIVVFIILVGAPPAIRLVRPPPAETGEKREPAPLPTWKWTKASIKAFPIGFDAFYRDRFGFRRTLIQWNSRLFACGLKVSPSPLVVVGKEDWLFYDGLPSGDGDSISDYRRINPLSYASLEYWRWTFQDLHEWHAARGIKFLLMIVPAKGLIYPEYLPARFTRVGEETPLEQVAEYLRQKTDTPFLDVTPALQAKKEQELVFFRTDSHWNVFGAYCGYESAMQRLAEWFPALVPVPISAFDRREGEHAGDLAQLLALHEDRLEPYSDVVRREPARAHIEERPRANRPDIVSDVDDDTLPRLVMYRDSFAEYMVPFLAEHFSHGFYRWNEHGFDPRIVEREKPDVVLMEMGDRRLRIGFRYAVSMLEEMSEQRFGKAEKVLARYDAESVSTLRPLKNVAVVKSDKAIVVTATAPDAHVEVPAISGADAYLPIVRLDVTFPAATKVLFTWQRSEGADERDHIPTRIGRPVDAGRQVLYLPLRDPELAGPIDLKLGGRSGTYHIHSLEVRGVPR